MTRLAATRLTWTRLALACVTLAGCAVAPEEITQSRIGGPTVADIYAMGPSDSVGSVVVDREKAIAAYREYLARYPDSSARREIVRRLADLLVESAADRLMTSNPSAGARPQDDTQAMVRYREAIAIYETLLEQDPKSPDSAELLYQLARALDESGHPQRAATMLSRLIAQHPNQDLNLYADAEFRRGEVRFSEKSYAAAERAFRAVVRLGDSVSVYPQSLYKLGWSLFKQDRYEEALDTFFAYLDYQLPATTDVDTHLATRSRAEQEQIADVFRAISLSFSYMAGVESVVDYFERRGYPPYATRIYRNLAELYIDRELVTNAAKTYLTLADRTPLAAEAPRLYLSVIALYQQAGLRQLTLDTQEAFVERYGLGQGFWRHHSPDALTDVVEQLRTSLVVLTREYYDRALTEPSTSRRADAQRWCRMYLTHFGDASEAAEVNFILAELLYKGRKYEEAIAEYERTAYARGNRQWGAKAAEAAWLTTQAYLKSTQPPDRVSWAERATNNALRFAETYPQRPGAVTALAESGANLLDRNEPQRAVLVSDTILKIRPPASPALRHTAWSLSAQAHFALGNYQQAEEAYKRTLQLTETADPRRKALTTGLAATIYKRGEERVAEGYAQEGAALFLRAARAAPDSPIHPKAQYDAAASLLAVESWSEATRVLEEFRTKHPEHELSEEAHRKLAYAYDRGGRPRQAAEEYLRLAQTHTEEQLRREALLRAARLFEQAGRPGDAVSTLEHYVDKFPQPAPEVVEVQQRLADIAATSGNNTERRRWLVAVIATDQQARHQRNERTRALAARARLELAQSDIAAFERSRLVAPVKRNLAQKLERMKGALSSLKEAAAYGVAPVTAAATYEMGRLYHELSRALLTSERPSNLNGEELAQYDLLLEEQAASFEQKAIEFYETNMRHLAAGYYDDSIAKTRKRLGELWPVRYAKEERGEPAVETLQ